MSSVRVLHGDCLRVMRLMRARGVQVDSIVTDPPYHLHSIIKRFAKTGGADRKLPAKGHQYARLSRGFMGKEWDGGDIAMSPETWALAYDLLKPGGHMIALCGTRTEHRVACAIEDAGFEIRDRVLWLYGSGFPKSHNVANNGAGPEWTGWGTALKPAVEIGVLARKPLSEGSVAANVLAHGTGALNIDATRIHADDAQGGEYRVKRLNPGASVNATGDWKQDAEYVGHQKPGRWPANVLHDGSDEVVGAFAAYGDGKGAFAPVRKGHDGKSRGVYGDFAQKGDDGATFHADTGTAARFFYSAKADKSDRLGSKHPTVKPVDLMAYLTRLITPPGGLVLDPFAGSGTTGMAAIREGFRAVLIEREAEYVADIHRRLQHVRGEDTPLFQGAQIDVEDLL